MDKRFEEVRLMKAVLDFIHKENAYNLFTGITKDNKIDIIEGKYKYWVIDAIDDIAIKVEYKEIEPYFYCYKGRMMYVTNLENTNIINDWKMEKRKIRKVTGEHKVVIEWETILGDGKYVWQETKNHVDNIILTDKQKQAIRDKLNYMNQKYKKVTIIY